jgi:NDP-sugar pyrophosphorylase family protein
MIPALVLTAGLATRLRPLSLVRAKAALPLAGEPLIRRILAWLAAGGVTDAVLNLHHLPHTLTSLVGDGADLDLAVRYSWEVPVLGSAGGPRRALPLLRGPGSGFDSTFLMVNGDTLTNLDLRALLGHHRASGALVTMAVVPNREPEKYSGVVAGPDGTVTGFARRGSTTPSFHFFGVQVAEAEAFASVPAGIPYESLGALYPMLMASRPGSVRVVETAAEYLDIGTPSDYLSSALVMAEREGRGLAPGARAQIDPTARIERSILWDDVVVEAGTMLRECVVTDRARVPADTSWHGVILRAAEGALTEGERRVGDLAVCSL